ncbi:MAG: hypothetical protein ACFFC7_23850 [Candidatus Hermodarchaeota archaeon]
MQKKSCPQCGSQDLEPGRLEVGRAGRLGWIVMLNRARKLIAYICKDCGFVFFYLEKMKVGEK